MAKPIVSPIKVFDGLQGTVISFVLYGNADSVNYIIYDNETGNQIASDTAEVSGKMANKTFQLPGGKITNQMYPYFIKIKAIYNETETELSDPVLFYCHSKPTLTFSNLISSTPNKIETSYYQFELNYNNVAEEGESLNNYQYHLYDSNKSILMESKIYYGEISNGFTVDGFSNNGIYYIRGTGETINGYILDTGYLSISVSYTVELNKTLLDVANNYKNGSVDVKSTIAFMSGVSTNEIEYIEIYNGKYVADLTENSIAYTIPHELMAYNIPEYFLRITVNPIIYKNIAIINHENDLYYISTNIRKFTDYSDKNEKFYVILKSNNYIMESNFIDLPDENKLISIYIMFKEGLFSLFIKILD